MRRLGRALAAAALAAAVAAAAPAASGLLTIETLLDIRHPSQPAFSPDGRQLAFVWDRAGVQDVWVVDAQGGPPRALTRHEAGLIDGLSWARDGQAVLFERGGDLLSVPAAGGGEARAVWATATAEGDVALSPDGSRAAFVRERYFRGHVLRDAWTRAERFFDMHLRPQAARD